MSMYGIYVRVAMTLFCSLVLLYCHSAMALEKLVVTGHRFQASNWQVPGRVEVITEADIKRSGVTQLVDMLRSSAGLEVSDLFGDGSEVNIGIRGFGQTAAQNTLVLVDGRRLNNADNSQPDFNAVSIGDIERVELVKGSMGALYGDKAVGGVINIITRDPAAAELSLAVGAGSYGHRTLFARAGNRHENGLGYRISAGRRLSDNYRDNNRLQHTSIALDTFYEYESGRFFLEYQGLSERLALPGALFPDQIRADRRQAQNVSDRSRDRTYVARTGIRQQLSRSTELQLEYTNRLNEVNGVLSSVGSARTFVSKRHHTEITPRLITEISLPQGTVSLTLGMDLFSTDYRIVSDFGITDDTQRQEGYYARLAWPILQNLVVTLGGRLGKVSDNILVDTLSFGRSLPEGTELTDSSDAWEVGFAYQLTSSWRLFGKLDRNYRFVTADEYSAVADNNYFTSLFGASNEVPLPQAQSGLSGELGAEWRGEANAFSVQVYQLALDDEIIFDPAVFLNTNLGDTRRRGILLETVYVPLQDLNLTARYSFLDAEYSSGPYTGHELTFVTRHSAYASAAYKLTDDWQFHVGARVRGDRHYGGDFANEFGGLQGYMVMDLASSYSKDGWRAGLQVKNLLNTHYSESGILGFDFRSAFPAPRVQSRYPAPGRHFMLTLEYTTRH